MACRPKSSTATSAEGKLHSEVCQIAPQVRSKVEAEEHRPKLATGPVMLKSLTTGQQCTARTRSKGSRWNRRPQQRVSTIANIALHSNSCHVLENVGPECQPRHHQAVYEVRASTRRQLATGEGVFLPRLVCHCRHVHVTPSPTLHRAPEGRQRNSVQRCCNACRH